MKRLSNSECYTKLTSSDCYKNTVDKYDKAKVQKARSGINPTTPGSLIGQVAAELGLRAHEDESESRPPSSNIVFGGKYAYVRGPRSGSETEKMSELHLAGYRTIALNTGDHLVSEWSGWMQLAEDHNMFCIPWARCFTLNDVSKLMIAAKDMNTPGLIVNLEQNADNPRWNFTGEECATLLDAFVGDIGVSTEVWMPENFNWKPLIDLGAICLPQTSVLEFGVTPEMAYERATVTFGWHEAYPSFATYDVNGKTPLRSDYVWTKNFGIYTVDDLAINEIAQWV